MKLLALIFALGAGILIDLYGIGLQAPHVVSYLLAAFACGIWLGLANERRAVREEREFRF